MQFSTVKYPKAFIVEKQTFFLSFFLFGKSETHIADATFLLNYAWSALLEHVVLKPFSCQGPPNQYAWPQRPI